MSTSAFTIADTHFEHDKIIAYCRPQFSSLEEMAEVIIDNWNSTVGPKDTVYHLGDVAICGTDPEKRARALKYLARLNGTLVLVAGNHDSQWVYQAFDRVFGAKERKRCIMTHVPVHPTQQGRFKMNIHGHLHEYYIGDGEIQDPFYRCVSVEQIGYTPILISEL